MKFLIAFLSLSLIINMYAMNLDEEAAVIIMAGLKTPPSLMPKPIVTLGPDSQSGEYPDGFYRQIIIKLRQEEQACADTTIVHLYKECKGCGDWISLYKTVTHLVRECTLSKILSEKVIVNSDQKVDMQTCQLCRMTMPEQMFLLHKIDRCPGKGYRVKSNVKAKKEAPC